jgi:hypothetical protein
MDMDGFRSYLRYIAQNCRWMLEDRPDQKSGKTWRRMKFDKFLTEKLYIEVREGIVMTAEFMAVPQNLEAEQSVIGGLLLDDDNSERVQKVLAMLKPESFYSRPHQLIFAEMRQMFRDNKPVDGLTLFDALEGKGLAEQVGGFAYLAEIAKNTPALQTSWLTQHQSGKPQWSATVSTA